MFSKLFGKKSILEELKEHPICKSYNKLVFTVEKGKEKKAFLNPEIQTCFNSGWFSEQDFKDWMNGTGKIVKGKTAEEKEKVWNYAKFVSENEFGWMIPIYIDYFDLILDDQCDELKYYMDKELKTALTITPENKKIIIGKILGKITNEYCENLKHSFNLWNIKKDFNEEVLGVKTALYFLGCGYLGACNTPVDISNLSWATDLSFCKAYYKYLVEKKTIFPDFGFIKKL